MKPAAFAYHRAHTVAEAAGLLRDLDAAGEEVKILAGGLSLVPMMNFRLARPSAIVDISRLDGLSYLRVGADGLRIGALTTHREVETCRDPAVTSGWSVLPRAARWIGHYPIRTRGTFGGSIAHADPASEWCLLAVLLRAQLRVTGSAGQRIIGADEFFEGYYTTALAPDEMLTEIWFAEPAPNAALTEFAVRQGDFAIVAAAVSVDLGEDRRTCRGGRVVLGGVGPRPAVIDPGPLAGQPASDHTWQAMGEQAAAAIDPPSDLHGTATYRRKLAATLVTRALAEAAAARQRTRDR